MKCTSIRKILSGPPILSRVAIPEMENRILSSKKSIEVHLLHNLLLTTTLCSSWNHSVSQTEKRKFRDWPVHIYRAGESWDSDPSLSDPKCGFHYITLFFKINFLWSIVDLQCCVLLSSPGPGPNLCPLHWEYRVLTTGPPGNYWCIYSYTHTYICIYKFTVLWTYKNPSYFFSMFQFPNTDSHLVFRTNPDIR